MSGIRKTIIAIIVIALIIIGLVVYYNINTKAIDYLV